MDKFVAIFFFRHRFIFIFSR